jgi:hypothetical protein
MMLGRTLLPSVALVASLAVLPGTADAGGMKIFHRTGTWASLAGINDRGDPQCVTMTSGSVGNATGVVMLKFNANNPKRLIVNLGKSSWKIPNEVSMRVRLQVDNAPARVYDAKGADNIIGFAIDLDDTDPVTGEPAMQLLFNLLMSGQTLNATFPDGNERPWQASLNGSAVELGQFATCIQTVKSAANPTQPFSPDNSTQPFRETNQEPTVPRENDEAIRRVIQPYLKM